MRVHLRGCARAEKPPPPVSPCPTPPATVPTSSPVGAVTLFSRWLWPRTLRICWIPLLTWTSEAGSPQQVVSWDQEAPSSCQLQNTVSRMRGAREHDLHVLGSGGVAGGQGTAVSSWDPVLMHQRVPVLCLGAHWGPGALSGVVPETTHG